MTFPIRLSHPALRGIEPADLTFWRGDHTVSDAEPPRPGRGGAMPIVVSGSAAGLDHAALVEVPAGRGCVVLSQLKLVEKFTTEPAAARILANLLAHLASYRPAGRRTGVVGGAKEYHAYLAGLGLRFDDLTKSFGEADLSAYSLILCRGVSVPSTKTGGGAPSEGLWRLVDWHKARGFVDSGGKVLLHRCGDCFANLDYAPVSREFDLRLRQTDHWGPVTRSEGSDPSLESILREDLYWLGEHVGIGWAETPRAVPMADQVMSRKLDISEAQKFDVREWKLEGQIVRRVKESVLFATNGSASADIEFPATADYVLGVFAQGTACHGIRPSIRVSLDGRSVGEVVVSDPIVDTMCTVCARVEKGRHKVSIAFINDASDPKTGADRNLHVSRFYLAKDDKPGDCAFLTDPPVVGCVRRGKGALVLDQLKWDTEERNARKAARYASTLLAALGGDFADRPSWAIECETMTPQPDMGWFRADNTAARFGCNGWIKTPIEVAAAGRYTMEVVAGGTPAQGVFPHVEIRIDGKKVGEVQLTSGGLRPYPVAIELPAGKHELSLAFTNDLNVGGEDRNLTLDKVVFYKE